MSQYIRVCRNCGIVFNIDRRKDKDCPLCHSGEHMSFRYEDEDYNNNNNNSM